MFNIGLPEFLIIVLVVVVFVDPVQLPGFFRSLGRGLGRLRVVRDGLTKGMKEVQEDLGLTGNWTGDGAGKAGRSPGAVPGALGAREDEGYEQGGGI